MLKALRKFTLRMVAGANLATIVVLFLVGHADRVNPLSHPVLANAGLLFPVFLLINLSFLVFWLVFHVRRVWIPVLGFLLCYPSLRIYMPLHPERKVPEGALKVMTYNVNRFRSLEDTEEGSNAIIDYICAADADIVCLQEATDYEVGANRLKTTLGAVYAYSDTAIRVRSGECEAVYSKFPIVGKEHIPFESLWNMSAAFRLLIEGDTVIVINNHLETNGLNQADKQDFKNIVKGRLGEDTMRIASRRLIDKLAEAVRIRTPEVHAVADYIRRHAGKSMIVCGDFNDNPLSYARRTIADGLTDCYVETGRGPGASYNRSGMYVRIDHLMCSSDWEPFNCKVDNKIAASDHYPLVCWLKKRPKH